MHYCIKVKTKFYIYTTRSRSNLSDALDTSSYLLWWHFLLVFWEKAEIYYPHTGADSGILTYKSQSFYSRSFNALSVNYLVKQSK